MNEYQNQVLLGEICPYCKSKTKVVNVTDVPKGLVGVKYFFACVNYPDCDSYTPGQINEFKPLGRLANVHLRRERERAYKNVNILKQRFFLTEDVIKS